MPGATTLTCAWCPRARRWTWPGPDGREIHACDDCYHAFHPHPMPGRLKPYSTAEQAALFSDEQPAWEDVA